MVDDHHGPLQTLIGFSIVRASLETTFSQWISIFPMKNELISLGKMKISWKNEVSKLALTLYESPTGIKTKPLEQPII